MPHTLPPCQLDGGDTPSTAAHFERPCEYDAPEAPQRRWAPLAEHTVAYTASRWSSPLRWRRALREWIAARRLPGATSATAAVFEDLVSRMDWTTGHARLRLGLMAENTGLKRPTLLKHIRILREGGWLAWVVHGSLRNAAAAAGRDGYQPTATVYAATIPPEYDEWAGNVLSGTGYRARVTGRTEDARAAAAAQPPYTPSLRVVRETVKVQVGGKSTTTASRPPKTKKPRKTILGARVTRRMADTAERAARYIRPLVQWTQTAAIEELSWVLLDLAARGWDEQRILVWVRETARTCRSGGGLWRPDRPHRYLAAQLRLEAALKAEADQRAAEAAGVTEPNEAFTAAARVLAAPAPAPALEAEEERDTVEAETLEEMRAEAELAWQMAGDGELVLAAVDHFGEDGARRLYGPLVDEVLRVTYGGTGNLSLGAGW